MPDIRDPDFYLAHASYVRALARRLVYDAEAADDVAQSAWLAALERPPRDGTSQKRWFARVVRNLASKALRTAMRRNAREQRWEPPPPASSPVDVLSHEHERQRVVAALLELDDPYRRVLIAHFFDGLSPAAIAARDGVPVETVRTQQKRGLQRLRARLVPNGASALALANGLQLGAPPLAHVVMHLVPGALLVQASKSFLAAAACLVLAWFGCWLAASAESSEPDGVELGVESAVAGMVASASAPMADVSRIEALPSMASGDASPPLDELHGVVIDAATKAPVPGAAVELLLADFESYIELDVVGDPVPEPRVFATTASDDGGRFRFVVVPGQANRLRVRANGYAATTSRQRVGGQIVRIELCVAASLTCVLRTESAFAEGVELNVLADETYVELARGRTDAAGTARFTGLRPGKVHLVVLGASLESTIAAIELVPSEENRIELRVTPAALVRGVVRDANTGTPITGALVARDAGWESGVSTDANGRFELGRLKRAGSMRYWVQARGYAPTAGAIPFGSTEDVDVRLTRGASVGGRVLAANGTPVPWAKGFLVAGHRDGSSVPAFDLRLLAIDEKGCFEVSCLCPGEEYWLLVRAPMHGSVVRALPRILAEGESLVLPEVVMPPQSTIAGRVVDSFGQPRAELVVETIGVPLDTPALVVGEDHPRTPAYVTNRIARTDANGRFCVGGLSAGNYLVAVRLPGKSKRLEATVQLDSGEVREGVDFVAEDGLALAGKLVCAVKPAAGGFASVHLYARSVGVELPRIAWTAVASDGSFRFVGLEPGRYAIDLRGSHPNHVLPELPPFEAGREDIQIVLESAASVSGRVLGPDGAPVFASVTSWPEGARSDSTRVLTAQDGTFRLEVPVRFRGRIAAFPTAGSLRPVFVDGVAAGRDDLVLQLAPAEAPPSGR